MADYCILTPYLIPPQLQGVKAVNIGDGFIARSIEQILLPHVCRFRYSTREPLTSESIEQINSTRLLVLGGANQLTDHFTVTPGMDSESLGRIRVPIVPIGVGLHGDAEFNQAMSPTTRAVLQSIHRRIRCSSWRCPQTVDYLRRQCPELSGQALMTCCPVVFREPLLAGRAFPQSAERVVVTVTERGDFWQREAQTIDFVSRRFPAAEKVLSLHQVYPQAGPRRFWRETWNRWRGRGSRKPRELHEYARRKGFSIFRPESVDECWNFYEACDLHFGSRLHAHLYFLSQAKRSYLSHVDERCVGISRALDFPLCDPAAWDHAFDYDFERCRAAARRCQKTMNQLVSSLEELLA